MVVKYLPKRIDWSVVNYLRLVLERRQLPTACTYKTLALRVNSLGVTHLVPSRLVYEVSGSYSICGVVCAMRRACTLLCMHTGMQTALMQPAVHTALL